MQGRQAKILSGETLKRVLERVSRSRVPVRDRAMVLLSVKAGLRACEISGLDWEMVLNPLGTVSETLHLESRIAKGGSGRRVPIHPLLRDALRNLRSMKDIASGPVISSQRGDRMLPNSIVNWFANLYRQVGLTGCSSHSGRRTFITNAARNVHTAGGSLRDVQLLAGHRSIAVTQRYIEGDTDAQRRLVNLI